MELQVGDRFGEHVLSFPCRLTDKGWVNAELNVALSPAVTPLRLARVAERPEARVATVHALSRAVSRIRTTMRISVRPPRPEATRASGDPMVQSVAPLRAHHSSGIATSTPGVPFCRGENAQRRQDGRVGRDAEDFRLQPRSSGTGAISGCANKRKEEDAKSDAARCVGPPAKAQPSRTTPTHSSSTPAARKPRAKYDAAQLIVS